MDVWRSKADRTTKEIEEGRAALPPRLMGDISLGPGVKMPNESDTP